MADDQSGRKPASDDDAGNGETPHDPLWATYRSAPVPAAGTDPETAADPDTPAELSADASVPDASGAPDDPDVEDSGSDVTWQDVFGPDAPPLPEPGDADHDEPEPPPVTTAPDDDVTSLNEDGEYYAAEHNPGESTTPDDASGTQQAAGASSSRARASARMTGAFSRFSGAGVGWDDKAGSVVSRYFGPVEQALRPSRILLATRGQRAVLAVGIILALISLLADSAGFALIVLGTVTPVLIVLAVLREDVFEKEPVLVLVGLGLGGILLGLILGWFGSWVVQQQWFDSGKLHYGAAGYGGRYADQAGDPNWLIYLVNGIVMPLAGLAAVVAVPLWMRRIQRFRNEIMDGAILGAITTAGYAIGLTIVFLAPGIGDGLPQASVSDWTLISLAVIFTRPTILVLGGAMLGIALWRYNREQQLAAVVKPAIGSVVFWLLLGLASVQLQASGVSLEFVFELVLAFAALYLFLQSIHQAVEIDRRALGVNGNRMVCPHCHKVTPVGAFCANCGQALTEAK